MPDISMCEGTNCPLKETCYRFTATPSEFQQSYITIVPYDHEKKECDMYWKDTSKKDKKS